LHDLRKAIPPHCFQPSVRLSFYHLARDLFIVTALTYFALYIPNVPPQLYLRVILWSVYGFIQGLFGTGLWIIAHDCG
ncbi:hypothetical protein DM02DRAFT_487637, partial [Periconia macrospinosa]